MSTVEIYKDGNLISSGDELSDIVLESGMSMYVSQYGSVSNITVSRGAELQVLSGGKVENITYDPWRGTVVSSTGAKITYASADAGVYYGNINSGLISKGNYIENLELGSGDECFVRADGAVGEVYVSAGGYLEIYGKADKVTNYKGSVYVGDKGSANVLHNPFSNAVTAHYNATVTYFSSGVWIEEYTPTKNIYYGSNLSINNDARGYVYDGGKISDGIIGNQVIMYSGGVIENTDVGPGGEVKTSGGILQNMNVTSGKVYISSGTTATNISLYEVGSMYVYDSESHVNNVKVYESGQFTGSVDNINIYQGGSAYIERGSGIYVYSGGKLSVAGDDNSIASLDNAILDVYGNCSVDNNAGCSLNVASNAAITFEKDVDFVGTSTKRALRNSGTLIVNNCETHVNNYHSLKDDNMGSFTINGDGVFNAPIANGGEIIVNKSVIFFDSYNTTAYGGVLTIKSDAVVSFHNEINLTNNTKTLITNDGTIDLNLSNRADKKSTALINRYDKISDENGKYTITVNSNQANGTYSLIGNAAAFDKTITIKNSVGSILGNLTVDAPLNVKGKSYSLGFFSDNVLCLTIAASAVSERKTVMRGGTNFTLDLNSEIFDGENLRYTISNHPAWIAIDETTGTLRGIVGQIPDSASGYGKTEVIIKALDNVNMVQEVVLAMTVIPDLITGDIDKYKFSMTDVIEYVLRRVNESEDENTFALSFNDVAFELFGIKAEMSDLSASVTDTGSDYEFKLGSKIALSIFNPTTSADDRPKLVVDFGSSDEESGEEKYIKLTTPHDFASLKIDIVGEMGFENFSLGAGFNLIKGAISVNTEENSWGGEVSCEFSFLKGAEISGSFEVDDGKVDSISVGADDLNIALGASGFFLNSIEGGVENIATPAKLELSGKMKFSFGPEILDVALLQLTLEGSVSAKELNGVADLVILDGFVGGADVNISIDMIDGVAEISGGFDLMFGIASIESTMTVTKKTITLSGTTMIDYSQYGLSYTVSSNVLLQYSNDSIANNDYILTWGEVEFFGMTRSIGMKFGFDKSHSIMWGEELTAVTEEPISTFSLRRTSPAVQNKQWVIDEAGIIIVSIASASEISDENYLLSLNDEAVAFEIIKSDSTTRVLAVKADKNDVVKLSYTDESMEISAFSQSAINPELAIEYNSLERKVTLEITSALPENVNVSFYYDRNGGGYDGSLIGTSTSGSFEWSIPEKLSGNFKFYAVVSGDGIIPEYSNYSQDTINLEIVETEIEFDSNANYHYLVKGDMLSNAEVGQGKVLEINGGKLVDSCKVEQGGKLILSDGTAQNTVFELSDSISIGDKFRFNDCEFKFDLSEHNNADYLFNSLNNLGDSVIKFTAESLKDINVKLAEELGNFKGKIEVDTADKLWSIAYNGYRYLNAEEIVRIIRKEDGYYLSVESVTHDKAVVWSDSVLKNSKLSKAEYFIAESSETEFQARTNGVWGSLMRAEYQGSADVEAKVILKGKNKICDIFVGSSYSNSLFLTNDKNGDALFIDDIYSASFDNFGESNSRLAQIKEIQAGDGDDIIDLTSNKFDYSGSEMTIYGGSGNDIIWANDSVDNIIHGGLGDDTLVGGSQANTFVFEANWGNDVIYYNGTVTLNFIGVAEVDLTLPDTIRYNGNTITLINFNDQNYSITYSQLA